MNETIVTDRMLEIRKVPNATVRNHDTVEDAIWHTINDLSRRMESSKIQGWEFDPEPQLKAIAQLVEISKKPVEVWME